MAKNAGKAIGRDHPANDQHMVTSSPYYRNRADIQRGMKKRDMPSSDMPAVSEKAEEKAVASLDAAGSTPGR